MPPHNKSEIAKDAMKPKQNSLLRTWKPRPKAFIVFADLDGTFTPMDLKGKIDFVNIITEIQEMEEAEVKFVPVSGRPAGYVLRILHDCRDLLAGDGITHVCEYGAAEQGALIVDSSKSYGPKFTGMPENDNLKQLVADVLKTHKHESIVRDEPDKLYTCSIHIQNEVKKDMTPDQQMDVYRSIRDAVQQALGDKKQLSLAMSHNCLEVMTAEISKAYAINLLLSKYSKDYNIVGCMYAGDAENDKVAMMYISKLAEIPGIKAHNFTPGNAQDTISSAVIDNWKMKYPGEPRGLVKKAQAKLFHGIVELIRDALRKHELCDTGVTDWRTKDDCLGTKPNPNGTNGAEKPKNSKITRSYSFTSSKLSGEFKNYKPMPLVTHKSKKSIKMFQV